MSKRQVLMIIGVWVILILQLGFPDSWDRFLLVLTGLAIIFMAYRMKAELGAGASPKHEPPYIDHHSPTSKEDDKPADYNPPAQPGTAS